MSSTSLDWRLRTGRPDDAAPLAEFAAATFTEAFGADNDPDDLAQHLAKSFSPAVQEAQLRDPAYRTLLATSTELDELVAYAQVRLGTAPSCVPEGKSVELLRFYVAGSMHGRGLAQELMATVLADAVALGGDQVWLSVWEENPRALAFYTRQGFVDVGSADFWVGSDRQTDRILLRRLEGA